jgi:hypothetical protein
LFNDTRIEVEVNLEMAGRIGEGNARAGCNVKIFRKRQLKFLGGVPIGDLSGAPPSVIASLRAAENGIKQDPGKNCLWVASPYGTEFRDGAASLRLHLRKAIPSNISG